MKAEISNATVKSLTYRAGTKETDPAAIGRVVIEFDADAADAGEIAALIGLAGFVRVETPQMALPFGGRRTVSRVLMRTDRAKGADA